MFGHIIYNEKVNHFYITCCIYSYDKCFNFIAIRVKFFMYSFRWRVLRSHGKACYSFSLNIKSSYVIIHAIPNAIHFPNAFPFRDQFALYSEEGIKPHKNELNELGKMEDWTAAWNMFLFFYSLQIWIQTVIGIEKTVVITSSQSWSRNQLMLFA